MKPIDTTRIDRFAYAGFVLSIFVVAVIIVREPADLVFLIWLIVAVGGGAEIILRLTHWGLGKIRWQVAVTRVAIGAVFLIWGMLELTVFTMATEILAMALRFTFVTAWLVSTVVLIRIQHRSAAAS